MLAAWPALFKVTALVHAGAVERRLWLRLGAKVSFSLLEQIVTAPLKQTVHVLLTPGEGFRLQQHIPPTSASLLLLSPRDDP